MFSLLLLSLSTCAASAAIDRRLDVPAGYVAAPYYPAPHGGWTSDWSESYRKASLIVSNLTLAEKTNITAGTGTQTQVQTLRQRNPADLLSPS
jgi:hypothetical protein